MLKRPHQSSGPGDNLNPLPLGGNWGNRFHFVHVQSAHWINAIRVG
jgi:hypothetical protein